MVREIIIYKYFLFSLISSFGLAVDEESIYTTLIDTNYDHGLWDTKIYAIYKASLEESDIEFVIPPFSSMQDISDNGNKILFTANQVEIHLGNDGIFPANESIMVYNNGTIDTLNITGIDPRFTNNGDIIFREIISVDNYNEIYRLYKFSITDSSQTLIVDSAYSSAGFTYKISPDNQKIVYTKDSGFDSQDIRVVNIDSGIETFITTIGDEQISEIWLSDIYWCNDSYLYFSVRDSSHLYQLFKINSSGENDTLTQLTFYENGLRTLATIDSHLNKIVLTSDSCTYDSTRHNCLFTYDFETNQTSYVGYTGGCLLPTTQAWSNDNSKVAVGFGFNCFFGSPGGIKVFDLDNGNETMIAAPRYMWWSGIFWINDSTDVEITDVSNLPNQFMLYQNYPNPFNPTTTLQYELLEDSFVNVTIYDILGNVVNNLVNANQSYGYKSTQWDATNNQGEPVSAGVYLYKIQAGNFVDTKKMILLK